ncbi:hypothetical protein [Sphingobium sp. MI1205]|uniref:hypothetical protein n=1 Tax=Sphingobium sp. MI1205 TaxID=407020 RepID=UPI000AA4D600|nr:hypothetical protein [Sphingobium sp. MI1205]
MSAAVPAAAVMIFAIAWFALSIIVGMFFEYRDRIAAALTMEPMPGDQRYRAGQPVERR